MLRKVRELKGAKSLVAFNGFNTLLLALKMLPDHLEKTYDQFHAMFDELDDAGKVKALSRALAHVALTEDEVAAMVSFCSDSNGVPYGTANINTLKLEELHAVILSVAMEISRIKVDILSEDEKKNSSDGQSISGGPT